MQHSLVHLNWEMTTFTPLLKSSSLITCSGTFCGVDSDGDFKTGKIYLRRDAKKIMSLLTYDVVVCNLLCF